MLELLLTKSGMVYKFGCMGLVAACLTLSSGI